MGLVILQVVLCLPSAELIGWDSKEEKCALLLEKVSNKQMAFAIVRMLEADPAERADYPEIEEILSYVPTSNVYQSPLSETQGLAADVHLRQARKVLWTVEGRQDAREGQAEDLK